MNEGIKYDSGKAKIDEMFVSFKNSLLEVCKVYEFGFNKYGKDNFKNVENGYTRYTNAMIRHLLKEDSEVYDEETELLHASHCAWNALARLEMLLKQRENEEQKIDDAIDLGLRQSKNFITDVTNKNKLETIKDILKSCKDDRHCADCKYVNACKTGCDDLILKLIEGDND